MADGIDFDELLARLPPGGMAGETKPEFQIAVPTELFVPPTLTAVDEVTSPHVTLISARGATGKSVLARQISALKAVPLWRLDADAAVSAHALEAKLNQYLGPTDALQRFAEDTSAFVVVDALDEARMRVSGLSWAEFISSLSHISSTGHHFVLLGRERVLEDIWLSLSDVHEVAWFEISHFDEKQRVQYVDSHVSRKRAPSGGAYTAARDAVLNSLEGTVDLEHADLFVGYAPVLDAVVALLAEGNLKAVENTFSSDAGTDDRIKVLASIIDHLLDREQGKANQLAIQLGLDPVSAYRSDEQIDWLASELMGANQPDLAWCPSDLRGDYAIQIAEFLRDHPFRSEAKWSSPVFAAYVAAKRFDDPRIRSMLRSVGEATSLLFEFTAADQDRLVLDEWQFAALHLSLLAAEWQSVEAVVTLVAAVSEDDEAAGELVLLQDGTIERRVPFDLALDRPGQLSILGPLASLSVDFLGTVTVFPTGASISLGPDCFIRSSTLRLNAETIQISRRGQSVSGERAEEVSVVLEVRDDFQCEGTLTGNPPEQSFELRVPPTIKLVYPWVAYRQELEPPIEPPNERAVRFLNMLMNLLRHHGYRGPMAVFDKKLEGRQSIKGGEFDAVLRALEEDGVVRRANSMIFLQPEWEPRRFSGKAREGLATLDDRRTEWQPVLDRIAGTIQS